MLGAGAAFGDKNCRWQIQITGGLDAGGVGEVRDDDGDGDVGEAAFADGIGDGEEVGTAAGEEDAELRVVLHWSRPFQVISLRG